MPVQWLIQAQDALQNSLGEANLQPAAYVAKLEELSQLIEATLPAAEAVVVVDCLHGYSSRQTLRVEAVIDGVSLVHGSTRANRKRIGKDAGMRLRFSSQERNHARCLLAHQRPAVAADCVDIGSTNRPR